MQTVLREENLQWLTKIGCGRVKIPMVWSLIVPAEIHMAENLMATDNPNQPFFDVSLFDPRQAFSRNLGWITNREFELLRTFKIAIAGMGGVGGHHAEVLARLGISRFHLSDFDTFEIGNFNRQNAAQISNVGRPKVEVIAQKLLDINPRAQITCFSQGVTAENLDSFLEGVDLYCDGLDFFVLELREKLFRALRNKNIPGITVAPIGVGAAMLVFDSRSMSFDEYFGMYRTRDTVEKAIRFLVGLAPSLQHARYIAEIRKSDFQNRKTPSLPMGCYLSAGVLGGLALKILLKRGKVYTAPHSLHFDVYNNAFVHKKIYFGHRNPLQQIKRYLVKKQLLASSPQK